MNRRKFIKTVLGPALIGISLPNHAFSEACWRRWGDLPPGMTGQLKDLLIWAPFEAFLPDETDPTIDDPSSGTETGILRAAAIERGQALTLQYWHGHGGIYHQFTVTAEHLRSLSSGNPVVIDIPTTVVDDHYHFAVIDPNRPATS